jgi:predicted CoA-binding protein
MLCEHAYNKKDKIKAIGMQSSIYNEQAEKETKGNGIEVVYNRCMMAEHKRLFFWYNYTQQFVNLLFLLFCSLIK